jgi:dephospho-CoA kinase
MASTLHLPYLARTVGLTGSIATGKTTVAQLFTTLGVPVIDLDAIARDLTEPHQPALKDILMHFGDQAVQGNGTLNRHYVRSMMMADPAKKLALESVLHPLIAQNLLNRYHAFMNEASPPPYIVVEIPLLFEQPMFANAMASTLVVACSFATQVSRLMQRSCYSYDEAVAMIELQMPLHEKITIADAVIFNDITYDVRLNADDTPLKQALRSLHEQYMLQFAEKS